MLNKTPFVRVVREIAEERLQGLRFTRSALLDLQNAAESHLVGFLEASNMCAIHAKRVTIQSRDMELVGWFQKHGYQPSSG